MKKRIAILCMIACVASGCSNNTVRSEESAQDTLIASAENIQEMTASQTTEYEVISESSEAIIENQTESTITEEANTDNSTETTASDIEETENILIAYFTWADNTYVEDPSLVDIDATTSASVLPPGNVGLIASWIQEDIGGDLFSIQVTDLYSSDYDDCLNRASEENAQNARPELATHVENMEQYDTVYIGYPNWWYSCPMALLSFLEEYDFSGKHIVLFCSHGTGGLAGSVAAIREVLPEDCTIEENVLGVYRPEVANSQGAVLKWLQEVTQ